MVHVHKHKKSSALKLLIELLFFLLLFFIAYKVFNALMSYWVSDLEQGTVQSLERLKIEIDNMAKNETNIPMYVDKSNQIVGYKNNSNPMLCRERGPCICICSSDASKESRCENNAAKKCIQPVTLLDADFNIGSRLDKDNKAKTFSCKLAKQEKAVKVTC